MPSSIVFKSDKFEMNAPVKIGGFNLGTILTDVIKDSFPEGFEIYDMINYPYAQAFLIGYQMDLMESFNPDDYLGILNNPEEIDPIYPEPIVIPKMTTDKMEFWYPCNMQDFFDDMMDKINADMSTHHSESAVTFPYYSPSFMEPYFDSITVAPDENTGTIRLDIWLTDAAPGVTVDLTKVKFGDSSTTYTSPLHITSSYTAESPQHVEIDISGAVIANNTKFILYGSSSSGTFTLYMKPQIIDITLSEATALKIGEMTQSLPPEIVNNINRTERIPDMLNAEIAEGEFRMTADPDPNCNCVNMIIEPEVTIHQDPVVIPDYYPPFDGLGKTFTKYDPSLTGELINGNELTVNESASKIIIKADSANGTTFNNLVGRVLLIKMDMGMDINELALVRWKSSALPPIDIPEINFANMGNQDEDVSFIRSITFKEINMHLDFTVPTPPPSPPLGRNPLAPGSSGLPELLEGRIALKVNYPELGFNNATKILNNDDDNSITSEPKTLIVNDDGVEAKVKFEAELIPVIGGLPKADSPYIEFGPVAGDNDITLNIYAQVSVEFDWKEAEIDVAHALEKLGVDEIEGDFPEDTEGNKIDLSKLSKYMNGVTFSDKLKAKIFLSGPDDIVGEIKLLLYFHAQWEGEDGTTEGPIEMIPKHLLTVDRGLPELPGKVNGKWVYTSNELPESAKGVEMENAFREIFTATPKNVRFHYKVNPEENQGTTTIYPHMFENYKGDTKIRALMVLLLPLELAAEPGGCFMIPSDIFGDYEDGENGEIAADLFDRRSPSEDSLFTGVNIKSLGIKIDFGYPLFAGSRLHFDRCKKIFGPDGLILGNGNSLDIVFTGEQQKAINENLIYPDIRFEFPFGGTMRIARNSLPVRIVISASGSYTLDLDDLFGTGN
jgi:hypothetical protein